MRTPQARHQVLGFRMGGGLVGTEKHYDLLPLNEGVLQLQDLYQQPFVLQDLHATRARKGDMRKM